MMDDSGFMAEADRFYLEQARRASLSSDDPKAVRNPRSAVGAVIADASGVIAASANVMPARLARRVKSSGNTLSESERYFFIEHAERAAIFTALASGKTTADATIYATRFPCADCARAIVWAGLRRAVFSAGFDGETRWLESQQAALEILEESGVTVRIMDAGTQV